MKKYFGIIKLTYPSLAKAELYELLKTYNAKLIESEINSPIITAIGDEYIKRIANRLVYTKYFAQEIMEVDYAILSDKTFRCVVYGSQSEIVEDIVRKIKTKTNARIALKKPDYTLIILPEKNLVGVLLNDTELNWEQRRPHKRKFFHPSSLDPRLCRLMLNLAHVQEGDMILDPFCGAGGILIEAKEMGMRVIGIDVIKKICYGVKENGIREIICGNSMNLPVRLSQVDAIVTDIPYGNSSNLLNNFLPTRILEELLLMKEQCEKIVIMCRDKDLSMISDSIKKSYNIYSIFQHKNLTRCIISSTGSN